MIKDESNDLFGIDDTQRLLKLLARCFMSRDHNEKAIDPSAQNTAVRKRHHRRRINEDAIVVLTGFLQEFAETWRRQELMV